MKLKVKCYDLDTSEPVVFLHEEDAVTLGVQENDRIVVEGGNSLVSVVLFSDSLMEPGVILIPGRFMERLIVNEGDEVEVKFAPKPDSFRSIRKKMDGI